MERIYTEGERMALIINALEGGNQRRFGQKVDMLPSTVSRVISGELSLRKHIDKIIRIYPEVSREWLVSGVGYPGDISLDIARTYYEKVIRDRNETIHILSKEIELQQDIIRDLQKKLQKSATKSAESFNDSE